MSLGTACCRLITRPVANMTATRQGLIPAVLANGMSMEAMHNPRAQAIGPRGLHGFLWALGASHAYMLHNIRG